MYISNPHVKYPPLHFLQFHIQVCRYPDPLYTVAVLSWLLSHPTALFGLPLFQETTKPVLKVPDTQAAVMACRTLLCCLDTALHALSPFMPFVTEELYHYLPHFRDHCRSESVMVAPYPTDGQVWLSVLWFYPWCGWESDAPSIARLTGFPWNTNDILCLRIWGSHSSVSGHTHLLGCWHFVGGTVFPSPSKACCCAFIVRVYAVQEEFFLDCLTLEDGSTTALRNIRQH